MSTKCLIILGIVFYSTTLIWAGCGDEAAARGRKTTSKTPATVTPLWKREIKKDVQEIAMSPDGAKFAVLTTDGITLVDANLGTVGSLLIRSNFQALTFRSDSRTLVMAQMGAISERQVEGLAFDSEPVGILPRTPEPVVALRSSIDGQTAVGMMGANLLVIPKDAQPQSFDYRARLLSALVFSPDGKYLVSVGWDGNQAHIIPWAISEGLIAAEKNLPVAKGLEPVALGIYPDSMRLVVGFRTEVAQFVFGEKWSVARRYSPLPVGATDDGEKKKGGRTPKPKSTDVVSVVVSPYGKFLIVGYSDGMIRILDADALTLLQEFNLGSPVSLLAMSATQPLFVATAKKEVYAFSLKQFGLKEAEPPKAK